jgi:hypothetical protein
MIKLFCKYNTFRSDKKIILLKMLRIYKRNRSEMNNIKASGVSKEIKNKYLKYIYLYAEKYLNKDEVR